MNAYKEPSSSPEKDVASWLGALDAGLLHDDDARIRDLFTQDSYWRDVLAFGWNYRTYTGPDGVVAAFREGVMQTRPRQFRISKTRSRPRAIKRLGRPTVEGFFEFDTEVGEAHGFVRLSPQENGHPRAWLLLTTLHHLRGFEEQIGELRPTGVQYSYSFAGDNWLEQRRKDRSFSGRDPEVLIVGAGHSGLTLGARLKQMGVDALIIDKFPRVGDNWRTRYHSLTLHNEVWSNHLPYMPFPPTWPLFLPKDKIAGWLEAYAEFMELNVWNSTTLLGADYEESSRHWMVRIKGVDGMERSLNVSQLVLAIGSAAGAPYRPLMPGLQDFRGQVLHSSEFTAATAYAGKRVIVIGTGVSGHDVAQELYSNGVQAVTLVQRSSTTVLSLVPSGTMVYGLYKENPIEDADLISLATPTPLLIDGLRRLTKHTTELDRALLDKLVAAGFEIDLGDEEAGFYLKYLRRGGGYYINVGCSDLIGDRKISLIQWRNVAKFASQGMLLEDGTLVPADVIIQATGYENQQETVRKLLGNTVANKLGPIWGLDEHGYLRNMWKATAQDRLWIMGGSMIEGRLYSRFLALLIKADLLRLTSSMRLASEVVHRANIDASQATF